MLSMTYRCISMRSRGMSAWNRTIAVFSQLENVSLSRDTAITSACLVTAQ